MAPRGICARADRRRTGVDRGAALRSPQPRDALGHDAARAAYLSDAFRLGDMIHVVDALGAVARARGLDAVAAASGIPQADLERALASDGVPDLATFTAVIDALGLRLAVEPKA